MYAIVEIAGKQFKVREGDLVRSEKLEVEVGKKITIDKVLLLNENGRMKIGKPYIEGASVEFEVLDQRRGNKIIVLKFIRKERYRRKYGHRQYYTLLKTLRIESGESEGQSETVGRGTVT